MGLTRAGHGAWPRRSSRADVAEERHDSRGQALRRPGQCEAKASRPDPRVCHVEADVGQCSQPEFIRAGPNVVTSCGNPQHRCSRQTTKEWRAAEVPFGRLELATRKGRKDLQ
jgi:hypothetical protein